MHVPCCFNNVVLQITDKDSELDTTVETDQLLVRWGMILRESMVGLLAGQAKLIYSKLIYFIQKLHSSALLLSLCPPSLFLVSTDQSQLSFQMGHDNQVAHLLLKFTFLNIDQ